MGWPLGGGLAVHHKHRIALHCYDVRSAHEHRHVPPDAELVLELGRELVPRLPQGLRTPTD
jgi:hypothetical protein